VSQQNDEFISFERALRDLQLQSEELKKLVSEGEIRAFRDGDSMKFRREDLEALRGGGAVEDDEEELVFTDALEDDTGMVTEELSDEDTLLADDDDELGTIEEPTLAATPTGVRGATPRGARARAAIEEAEEKEPGWVTVAAVLCTVLMIWASMILYTSAMGNPPAGMTAMWAPK